MMNRIVFCPECRQDVKFSVREKPDSAELKGEVYEFTTKTAYCNECGTEVYVSEIEDVEYLLFQSQDITHLSLQKALYYVQGFYNTFFGSFIFEEDCEAWVHGPVYRDIYRRYSGYCYNPIDSVEEPDITSMPVEEKVLLDSVIKHLCCYSGKTLESFTHVETPWISTRGNLPTKVSTDRVIPKQIIGEYFSSVKYKYRMLTPANIKDYAQDMFSNL